MNEIHAILWDNDGVLIDSESIFYGVTRMAFTGLGLDLTPEVWGTQYLGGRKSHSGKS